MRMGSIGLLYATQTRAPHCSHSQLNDCVDGIGTSSTRGQVSTSRNSGMMHSLYRRERYRTLSHRRLRHRAVSVMILGGVSNPINLASIKNTF